MPTAAPAQPTIAPTSIKAVKLSKPLLGLDCHESLRAAFCHSLPDDAPPETKAAFEEVRTALNSPLDAINWLQFLPILIKLLQLLEGIVPAPVPTPAFADASSKTSKGDY